MYYEIWDFQYACQIAQWERDFVRWPSFRGVPEGMLNFPQGRRLGETLRSVRENPKAFAKFFVSSTHTPIFLGISARALRRWGIRQDLVTWAIGGTGLCSRGVLRVCGASSRQ